jgi:WXXGXW repeat (2 copies)
MRKLKIFLSTTFLAALFLGAASSANAQVSIGIRIGAPPPPRVVRVQPARPGPDWVWIEGYWYPVGKKYHWHEGYWTRVPYAGAHWVGPRYEGGQFFAGFWDGDRGRVEHDHRSDHDRDRDYRH